MNTTITRVAGGPCKLSEFAERNNLTMAVNERPGSTMRAMRMGPESRFYAKFDHAELREGSAGLLGMFGDGATPDEAIEAYGREIAGGLLIIHAMQPDKRREIQCPNEWLPEG
jgi:hypothetical protein